MDCAAETASGGGPLLRWGRLLTVLLICLNSTRSAPAQSDAAAVFGGSNGSYSNARPFPGGASAASFPTTPATAVPQVASTPTTAHSSDWGVQTAAGWSDQLPGRIERTSAQTPAKRVSARDLLGEPVAEIRIIGNRTIPTYAIEKLITNTRVGRPINSDQLLKDKTTLVEQRWFISVRDRVELGENGPIVIFEVMEAPTLDRVQFIGNDKGRFSPFNDEKLSRETGLVAGHGFDPAANIESVQRIRQKYIDKGYNFVEVNLKKGGHRDDREVIIEIKPGPRVGVTWTSFDGNQFVSDAVLRTHIETERKFGLWFRGRYNPEVIRNDTLALKSYYEGLGFFDVDVQSREEISDDKASVWVTYVINEGQRYQIRNIELEGNAVLARQQLVGSLKLKPRDYFNSRFLQQDAQAMKDKYDALGRPFASVTPVPRFLPEAGQMDLVYQVNEDQVCRIGSINIRIRGDETHTRTDAVRNRINRYLQPGALAKAKDIQAARTIVSTDPIFDRDEPPEFNVRRVIGDDYMNNGNVSRGQNVSYAFGGQTNLKPTSLNLSTDRPAGELSPLWTPPSVQNIFSGQPPPRRSQPAAPQQTAPTTKVQPAGIESAPAARQATDSQPMAYLAPPARGRRDTSTSVATAEVADESSSLLLRPAQLFDDFGGPAATDDGMVYRAQSTDAQGLPNPQNYMYSGSNGGDPFGNALRGTTPDFVDIDIDVTEGRTGRLMFGAGVNSNAGVVGNVVLQEDNFDILAFPRHWGDIIHGRAFRGGGQSFRLEAVPGSQVSRYTASWRTPYFMGTDFSFGVDGFYYNRYFENWTEDRLGGRLSLGYILNRYWTTGVTLRLESVNFHSFLNVPQTPQLYRDAAGRNFLSTAQFRIARDTRDSPFLPSKGNMVELSYEQAFGEFSYPRIDLTAAQHFTLWERADGSGKHTLMVRGETVWTGDGTPVFERLYAGGFQSFRGFQFRGVAPRENSFRVGGQYMSLGTVEYQFPITAGDGIRGVLFSDFGTVDSKVSYDKFRATAGFGFRFFVPAMGPAPLAFDFAWPILQETEDNTQLFSFYVGTTF
ncbi:MAG: BamA/TamA family outer membrane protein [Planctomycetaceae bacterium]